MASVQPPPIFQPGTPKPDTGSSLPRRGGCFLEEPRPLPKSSDPCDQFPREASPLLAPSVTMGRFTSSELWFPYMDE